MKKLRLGLSAGMGHSSLTEIIKQIKPRLKEFYKRPNDGWMDGLNPIFKLMKTNLDHFTVECQSSQVDH